jgi:ribosome-binding factor A
MMMSRLSYKRTDRISDLIMREISEIIFREVKDPRIGMVTLTRVEVSDDLSLAKIYYSIIGSEKEFNDSAKGLSQAAHFIQRLLGKRLALRHIPHLNFIPDHSLDYSFEIEGLIKKIKEQEKEREE